MCVLLPSLKQKLTQLNHVALLYFTDISYIYNIDASTNFHRGSEASELGIGVVFFLYRLQDGILSHCLGCSLADDSWSCHGFECTMASLQ